MIEIKVWCECDPANRDIVRRYKNVHDLLAMISHEGWSICEECGDECEFEVIKDANQTEK